MTESDEKARRRQAAARSEWPIHYGEAKGQVRGCFYPRPPRLRRARRTPAAVRPSLGDARRVEGLGRNGVPVDNSMIGAST